MKIRERAKEIYRSYAKEEWEEPQRQPEEASLGGIDRWNACVEMAGQELEEENERLHAEVVKLGAEVARLQVGNAELESKLAAALAEIETLKAARESVGEEKGVAEEAEAAKASESNYEEAEGEEYYLEKIEGTLCIKYNDVVYCNSKYHRPYLAKIIDGEPEWQEKKYVGYGKHAVAYYVVEELKAGDYIKMAGGSGCNRGI